MTVCYTQAKLSCLFCIYFHLKSIKLREKDREEEKTPSDRFRVQMRFMNFPQKMPSVAIRFRLFDWSVNVIWLTHSKNGISISGDRVTYVV